MAFLFKHQYLIGLGKVTSVVRPLFFCSLNDRNMFWGFSVSFVFDFFCFFRLGSEFVRVDGSFYYSCDH